MKQSEALRLVLESAIDGLENGELEAVEVLIVPKNKEPEAAIFLNKQVSMAGAKSALNRIANAARLVFDNFNADVLGCGCRSCVEARVRMHVDAN